MGCDWDCHCWLPYPNQKHKHKSGKWKCADNYECIRNLVQPLTNYYNQATHCKRKEKKKDEVDY